MRFSKIYFEVLALNNTCLFRRATPVVSMYSVCELIIWLINTNLWTAFNDSKKVKVKGTLVQAMRLCTGRTAHKGSKGIALPFQDYGTRKG